MTQRRGAVTLAPMRWRDPDVADDDAGPAVLLGQCNREHADVIVAGLEREDG
jgi:hypothetical protein